MPQSLILVASNSVATVACAAAVGAYARWRGVLDKSGVKTLEKLVAEVFTPALVLLKVLPNVSIDTLASVWPNALMCVMIVGFGFGAGRVACRVLQQRHPAAFPQLSGLMTVAIAFPNSFSVPLTLFLAMADHPAFVTADATASPADRGTSAFLFSYVLWILARWSIGYPALAGACQSSKAWAAKVLNPPTIALAVALPVGAVASALHLTSGGDGSDGGDGGGALGFLAPLHAAIEYASRCLVPATLLTLGAQLGSAVTTLHGRREQEMDAALSGEDGGRPSAGGAPPPTLPAEAYAVLILLRQVAGPLLGCALIGGLRMCGALTDPVTMMVALLQSAGPPMINLAVMAGLAGGEDVSRACALVLLVTYCASIVTWTGAIALFLRLVS